MEYIRGNHSALTERLSVSDASGKPVTLFMKRVICAEEQADGLIVVAVRWGKAHAYTFRDSAARAIRHWLCRAD
jgi:hypothetical protein